MVDTPYIDRARVLKRIGRNRRNRDRHIRNRLRPLGRRDDNRVHGVIARIVGAFRRCGRERRLLILSLRWNYGAEGGNAAEPDSFPPPLYSRYRRLHWPLFLKMLPRSEERRGGKEGVSTGRTRWG